jgi:hypothetical protein
MRSAICLLFSLAACGGPRATSPGGGSAAPGDGSATPGDGSATDGDGSTGGDAATPGGVGSVCALGRLEPDREVVVGPCAEGLQCCYPCGIQGCDSVCMVDCGPPRP